MAKSDKTNDELRALAERAAPSYMATRSDGDGGWEYVEATQDYHAWLMPRVLIRLLDEIEELKKTQEAAQSVVTEYKAGGTDLAFGSFWEAVDKLVEVME